MTKNEIQRLLQISCCANDIEGVRELFCDYPNDIDLMENDGQAFAICMSYGYVQLLRVLIDYYKETKLQEDIESKAYKIAYHHLQYMLENAQDQTEPSPEIQSIIDQYISDTKDSDSDAISTEPEEFVYDNDAGLAEHRDSSISAPGSDGTLDLTIDNLKQWNEECPMIKLAGIMPDLGAEEVN